MRILILNFILSTAIDGRIIRRPSNSDTMIYNMARGFVASGHEVTLCASEEFKPLKEEKNEFEIIYFPSRLKKLCKPHLLPYPKGFSKYLRENKANFDMILAIETFSIPTLIASRICPEKMLIWQEVGKYQRFMHEIPARIWCKFVARHCMRRIPAVAMSQQAREFIRGFMDNVNDRVIAHGADNTVFKPSESRQDYFIVIAMLIKRKRIDTIISAFAGYVKINPDCNTRLKIVGEGPEETDLRALAKLLNVADRIDFLGFMRHTDFAPLAGKAIAFLVNTASDLNMVSVTESVANGTPVLMNSVATTSAFIKELKTGIVRDNWGAQELSEMKERYREFHANCIANRNQFTNTGVAANLCDIFGRSKR